jgi:L-amino acid N-acyltransferase YncA
MPEAANIRAEEVVVRAATSTDAPAIASIYNEGIRERRATFQTRLHSPADFLARIADGRRPFLVAVSGPEVVAWAAVLPYSDPAPYYAGVGEATLYVAPAARGQGVGAKLLTALASEAERRGFHKLIGKIFTSNLPSIALVNRCGYRTVGVHLRHGQLDGEWKDVLVVELLLPADPAA